MQLISIGDVVLNLDQITVLDLDRTQNGIMVRVHTDSSQPIIEVVMANDGLNRLFELVPKTQRFSGRDA